jgi:hypothetical protein
MKSILIGGILLGFAVTSPAAAAESAVSDTQAPAAEGAAKPEKVICKRDNTVGTRLSRATCLTKSQWKARERQADEQKSNVMDRINRAPIERPMIGTPTSSGG